MTRIVLTDNQARSLAEANGGEIILVDSQGKCFGTVQRPVFTDQEIADAERRANSGGPWYTTDQVLAHLRSLAPE